MLLRIRIALAILVALLIPAGRSRASPGHDESWWVHPIERLALRINAFDEHARPYSTPVHPRDLAGSIAVSCEHREGRPCGDGLGGFADVDAAAGYRDWIAATVRVRARGGTQHYDEQLDLNRAYLHGRLGVIAYEVGRDVLLLGPASRTRLGWGDNAPPVDQIRMSTARPLQLGTPSVHGELVYVLARLRAPQTYPGNFTSITRGQLDLGQYVVVGMMQLLQLAGEGAPSFGVWDFVLEHVRRGDASASATDSSNRRIGFDVSWVIPELRAARLYYQVVFEDWRKRFHDALRHDADHLVGVEVGGLVVELEKTGVRSQEHTVRTTGFTNAGRVVGSPLGPDAEAAYAGRRIELGRVTIVPWIEVARLSSDPYMFVVDGPILHLAEGVREKRYRVGASVQVPVSTSARLEIEALEEHVIDFAFVRGERRDNYGASAAIIWQP